MSTSSSAVDNISVLANAIFKRVDTNGDGKLNVAEFQSFLENLIGKAGSATNGLGTQASAGAAPQSAAADAHAYQPMMGFDYVKLNTMTHTTPKYVFARATQDVNLAWDRASRSAGLQQIVDNVKQNGYPDAKVTGKDSIDFGDGNGDIDVLTSEGTWWWGPKN
jgi:hypothetical protein